MTDSSLIPVFRALDDLQTKDAERLVDPTRAVQLLSDKLLPLCEQGGLDCSADECLEAAANALNITRPVDETSKTPSRSFQQLGASHAGRARRRMVARAIKHIPWGFCAAFLGASALVGVMFTLVKAVWRELNSTTVHLKQLAQNHGDILSLFSGMGFLIGIALCVVGAMGLQQHAEDPRSSPMSGVLVKIIAGISVMGVAAMIGK